MYYKHNLLMKEYNELMMRIKLNLFNNEWLIILPILFAITLY